MWSAPNKGTISLYDVIVKVPYDDIYCGDYIDFLEEACHDCNENDFQEEVNYVVFRGDNGNTDMGGKVEIGSTEAVDIFSGYQMREGWSYAISDRDEYRWNY